MINIVNCSGTERGMGECTLNGLENLFADKDVHNVSHGRVIPVPNVARLSCTGKFESTLKTSRKDYTYSLFSSLFLNYIFGNSFQNTPKSCNSPVIVTSLQDFEQFVCLVVVAHTKVGSKCSSMTHGTQSVVTTGVNVMPMCSADSLAIMDQLVYVYYNYGHQKIN